MQQKNLDAPHLNKENWETVDSIGNVYNRLVIFNAQYIHAVSEYFGEDITNSRLFQLFFFNIHTKKELKFIHITKCAGTSIEDIGKKNNINWGRFHEEYGFWHDIFRNKPIELKKKYDWFLVVRNPYDRILSEFYCRWGGIGENTTLHNEMTEENFNNFCKYRILNRDNLDSPDHYREQYLYIDSETTQHIIHFENLENEFNLLMKQYNLNIKLDKHENKGYFKSNFKKFTVDSFSPELIDLINKVYHKDFEMFNYKKM